MDVEQSYESRYVTDVSDQCCRLCVFPSRSHLGQSHPSSLPHGPVAHLAETTTTMVTVAPTTACRYSASTRSTTTTMVRHAFMQDTIIASHTCFGELSDVPDDLKWVTNTHMTPFTLNFLFLLLHFFYLSTTRPLIFMPVHIRLS